MGNLYMHGYNNEMFMSGSTTTLCNIWDGEGEIPTESVTIWNDDGNQICVEFMYLPNQDDVEEQRLVVDATHDSSLLDTYERCELLKCKVIITKIYEI